jgi:phenylpropionate dioxygenase-like ring-hydroxylating dioxygenase large terminal subunit
MTVPIVERYAELRFNDAPVEVDSAQLERLAINPAAGPGDLDAKSPPLHQVYPEIGSYRTVSTERFYRSEVMQAEWQRLWPRTWIIAGLAADVANVGDWFTYEIGDHALVIVRSDRNTVRAFYNVCKHRGNRLVRGDFGSAATFFTCGFHSWRWNIKGKLARITDRGTFDPAAICGDLDLGEVRVQAYSAFIFINLDGRAPPLETYLGAFRPTLDSYAMEELRVVRDVEIELAANWKVAINAFQETYHAHAQHPQLKLRADDVFVQYDYFAGGHSRMITRNGVPSPRLADRNALTPVLVEMLRDAGLDPAAFEGRALAAREAIQAVKRAPDNVFGVDYSRFTDSQLTDGWACSVFPNTVFTAQAEGMNLQRFRPHPTDPERCFYNVFVLVRPSAGPQLAFRRMEVKDEALAGGRPARHYGTMDNTGLYEILEQDVDAIPHVQKGMRSPALPRIRLGEQEGRLQQFFAEIDRYLDRP